MASAGEGKVMSDWAELPSDLLTSIAKRVRSYEDFVAFRGVCSSWRSVAVKESFNHTVAASSRVQIPWLMLAEEGGSEIREFSSLTKGGMVRRVELPEARGRHCIGSLGWLITTDEQGNAELLHPLTRVRIPLPHPTAYKYYQEGDGQMNSDQLLIRRAVLSASPSVTDDYVLMVIIGSNRIAAYWKPGNNAWTQVRPHQLVCLDVIYYKDRFYAIKRGSLVMNPNSGGTQIVYEKASEERNAYLVESPGGDLLVVSRERDFYYNDDDDDDDDSDNDDGDGMSYRTCSFSIYKFDSTDMNKWEKINDLEGVSIFVGHSAATAVPASAADGIKPNCIYFTDDYTEGYSNTDDLIGGQDTGIYSLETQTFEFKVSAPLSNYCPPIWVFPSF